MSSNYRKGSNEEGAALALDSSDKKSYFHTKCGKNEWWSALFNGKYQVFKVRIQNRISGAPNSQRRLEGAEVTIEGRTCGFIPDSTPENGLWYDIVCDKPIIGGNIMVSNRKNTCLHFSSIEVHGYYMDPKGSRGLNVVALNPENHKVVLRKSYDTYSNDNASGDLVRDYRELKRGSIVIVSVKDEGSKKFSDDAKALFTKIGSKDVSSLKFREGWAFIGIKGSGQFVEKKGGRVGTGLILGYAQPERKVKKTKEVSQGSEIVIYSGGYKAGKKNSYATITVNGEDVLSKKKSRRGINLVVLNGENHEVIHNKRYNTYKKKNASNEMKKYIKSVPKGSIIIAAVKDEASKKLTYSGRRVFMKMGAKKIWKMGYKKGWAFVGIKGMKVGKDIMGLKVNVGAIFSYTKSV